MGDEEKLSGMMIPGLARTSMDAHPPGLRKFMTMREVEARGHLTLSETELHFAYAGVEAPARYRQYPFFGTTRCLL